MMRLGLVALCALLDPAQATDSLAKLSTNYLRSRSSLPQQQHEQNRRLAAFAIPYTLLWRIEIGNGGNDRQPTEEEYEAVRQVTVDWFDSAHAAYYANSPNVTFVSTNCDLVPEGTAWDPTADYPHKIQLFCNAYMEADALEDLPSNIEFILSINEEYDFEDFTRNYLWNAPPPDNVFRYSQRVGYTLTDNGPAGPAGPSIPTSQVAAPTSSPSALVTGFSGQYVLPFAVRWEMAVGEGTVDREPSGAEYDGMLQATIDWFSAEINAYYADQADAFTLSEYVAYNEPPPTWTAGQQYPHSITQDCYATFNANNMSDIPTVLEFLQDVGANFDVTAFIKDYLRAAAPEDSIFHQVTLVRYTSSTTTPAGPLASPTAPVATEAPTMPPSFAASDTSSPTVAPNMATGGALPVPTPTLAVGTFPTNPPITGGGDTVILETVTLWKYSIGFGIPDRQPTLEEYEGYIDSTEAWLTSIYEAEYNNDTSTLTFDSLTSEIQLAEFDSLADPSHTIILKTQYVFTASEEQTVPSQTELLLVISDADLIDYMLNYLHESQPRFNVFIGTKSVTWGAGPVTPISPPASAPTMAPTSEATTVAPTAPATEEATATEEAALGQAAPTDPPIMPVAPPTDPPVMPPTEPPSSAPSQAPSVPLPVENGGGADLSNLDSVRVFMTMSFGINVDRYEGTRLEPTDEEWDGFLLATKKFLTASFREYYEGNTEAEFVGLLTVLWATKSFTAEDELPYYGEFQMDVAFMDGSTLLPSSAYWSIINAFDFGILLRQYVWTEAPADSIFHYASELTWNYINNQ